MDGSIALGIAGTVAGIVAIKMATQPLLQVLYGQPRLRTKFEVGVEGVDRFLLVYLDNPPIKNRILKKLKVKRNPIQSLTVQFRIREAGSGKIVDPIRNARIFSDDDDDDSGHWRISLPPTFSVSASIMVARWDTQKKKACVLPDRTKPELILESGQYKVDIIFLVDGEEKIETRQFVVGQEADDLKWITPARS